MSVQKQSEIATNFTNKLLNLISKTNKELQKIDGNSWISDIDIIYQLSHLSHLWETPENISLKVSVKTDANPIKNNNISNFTVEITE